MMQQEARRDLLEASQENISQLISSGNKKLQRRSRWDGDEGRKDLHKSTAGSD